MLGDVQGEARLADGWPRGDHDQVALLEPRGERVQVGEAGPDAADLATVGVEVVEPVVGVVEQRLQRAEPGIDPLLADREQLRLGAVDRLLDLGRVLVADPGDPAGRSDQVPQDRLALHDPCVLRDVDRGRGLVRQAGQVGTATDGLELVAPFEGLGDGDDVDRLATLEQVEDRRVDPPVGLPVEVGRSQELGHLDHRVAVDQDGAKHRLLGLETLWRQAVNHAGGTPSALGRDCQSWVAEAGPRRWLIAVARSTNFSRVCPRCGQFGGYPRRPNRAHRPPGESRPRRTASKRAQRTSSA